MRHAVCVQLHVHKPGAAVYLKEVAPHMPSRDDLPQSVVPDIPGRPPPDSLTRTRAPEDQQGLGGQQALVARSRVRQLPSVGEIDRRAIELSVKWFEPAARISIFVIYFWFGILKALGLSPATPLAQALTSHTIGMQYFNASFKSLAVFECALGILFLIPTPAITRASVVLVVIHLGIVSSPLVLVANVAWVHPLVPTLEGQYIIKDLAILALAVGIMAQRQPLPER